MSATVARRVFAASVILLIVACARLAPYAAGEAPTEVGRSALDYAGGIVMSGQPEARGLSGLAALPGDRLLAVRDDGVAVTLQLRRDEAGRLVDADVVATAPIGGTDPAAPKRSRDAEALVPMPGGGWLVAFEGEHRVMAWPPGPAGPTAEPARIPLPAAVRRLPGNRGIEALAALADGSLVAIAEAAGEDGLHPAWRRVGASWEAHRYRAAPGMAPSDAAALPDGDLLVLERGFSLFAGFSARLALLPADALAAPVWEPVEIARLAPPIGLDNLEGLAVRPVGTDRVDLYIVSDDNFSALQRTLLLQYTLDLAQMRTLRL